MAADGNIGRYVPCYTGTHGAKRMTAYATKLVHYGKSAEYGVVMNLDVPPQRGRIGHNHMVGDLTIMGYMSISHEKIVVSDTRGKRILYGSPVDSGEFADYVAVTDFETGLLSCILHVLRNLPNGGELEYAVVPSDSCRPINYYMGTYPGTFADNYTCPDNGEWPDVNILIDLGTWVDNGSLVYQALKSLAVHIMSAVQTILSSTMALPVNTPIPRFNAF